jgi:hypothetical protein
LNWHYLATGGVPALIVLRFIAWFAWLALFALLQRRLCLQYPGIRTVCQILYLGTAIAVILPALWVFRSEWSNATQLVASLNKAFGMGVYIQTFLRSIFLVKLLYCVGGRDPFLANQTPFDAIQTERNLIALLVLLAQTVTSSASTLTGTAKPPASRFRAGG